jgi:hypothetical protein
MIISKWVTDKILEACIFSSMTFKLINLERAKKKKISRTRNEASQYNATKILLNINIDLGTDV